MKKYIFTENQIKTIINNQIQEQTFVADERAAIDSASEEFLNLKGIKGISLSDKIKKYQKMIGCEETGHMMDCIDTMYSKYNNDFKKWKDLIYNNQGPLSKLGINLGKFINKLLGNKEDEKSIY